MRALPLLLLLTACPNRPGDREPHDFELPRARSAITIGRTDLEVFLDEQGSVHIGAMRAGVAEVEHYIRARYPTLKKLYGFAEGTPMQVEEREDVGCPKHRLEKGQYIPPPEHARLWTVGLQGRQPRGAPIAGAMARPGLPVILRAAATADARQLVDLVIATGGAIAARDAALGDTVLRIDFSDGAPATILPYTIALRVTRNHVELDRVGSFEITHQNAARLTELLYRSRSECNLDPETRLDVIVEHGVDVQHLVEVIEALEMAGEEMIGLAKS